MEWFDVNDKGSELGLPPIQEFKVHQAEALRHEPLLDVADEEAAGTLLRVVHSDLIGLGTNGPVKLWRGGELATAQKALVAVLWRLGFELNIPWRDADGFRDYWAAQGCSGSWQARRLLVRQVLDPAFDFLDGLEESRIRDELTTGVTSRQSLGWPAVDAEIAGLRQRFQTARSAQDYRDVGNRCVAVVEALSAAVYDPSKHLRDGETEPPVAKSKQRLERYVEGSLAGKENLEVRGLATKVINLAQAVKHASTPSRRDAGIAADSVILLVNILRRVDQDQ
ncbi:hypothetical protein EDD41_2717 [Luteococcus japonicus]|uniref:Uncharacterized protein n=1 Tax=Luteococcus japonicus TaxID=33984 RepID=A0A3N1ZX70_9ACTN|nr:hypothetical protein [Luteococcus japonicus]ROR55443.1 hypothetical protein EDD41_2717 [Luteococcus japonicus]